MKINIWSSAVLTFFLFLSFPLQANWVLPDDVDQAGSPFETCTYQANNQTVSCPQTVNLNQSGTLTISTNQLSLEFAQALNLPAGVNINPGQQQFTISAPSIQNNSAPLNLNANLVSTGRISLFGDASSRVRGNLQAQNQITVNNITVEGNVQAGQLTFDNGATIAGNAQITGSTSFNQGSLLGNLTAGGDVALNNQSLIRGSVSTSGALQLNNGNIDGSVTASGDINFNNGSQVTASVSSQQRININHGVIGGSLTARSVTMNNTSSRVAGNLVAQEQVTVNAGRVAGNLDTDGDVVLESGATIGSVNSRGIVTNRGTVNGYINAPFLQPRGTVGEACNLNNNFGPCTSQPGAQLATSWCADIWQEGVTTNSFYPGQINLPEEALDFQLPRQLEPTDYLRRGVFGDVGENYVTNGATSRIFVDGDLTIQAGRRLNTGGPSHNFMLVVTGTLTIEANVQINGYIYANRINFAPRRCTSGFIVCFGYEAHSVINGAISSATNITSQGSGNALHQPVIQYRSLPRTLNGGRFCLNTPRTELSARFNDGPFINTTEDSSTNRFNIRAINSPGFSSALPALPTNSDGFGTCGYTVLDNNREQFFEVSNAAPLNFSGSFTVGAWVRPRSRAELMTIGSKDENFEFHVTGDGRVNWWWQTRNGVVQQFTSDPGVTVPLNQWTYVAIRYTPREQTIFINSQRTTRNFSGGLRQNSRPLQIGSDQNAPGRYFNGFIDDFTVIRGALSNDEITALRQQRVSCRQDILVCEADSFDVSNNLAENWEVRAATVNGQTIRPRIVDNQLRLTEAQQNQAAVASLRRSFPSQGNLIELEFNANMYTGGSSGGDGMAVVFSDASKPPIQGGSGGSLGYAPRPDLSQSGFNGAWLAIGLDAHGNFSQASPGEGREGGLSQPRVETANRVSMRGANYQFVPNSHSPQLSPGMRSQANSRGPAHRYRIRLDTRIENQALVTVQRNIDGSGFQTVVETFNLYNALPSQQDNLPDNLRISFTAATGASVQISEIDDVRVCAERSFALAPGLDHIRLHHPGEQISCQAAPLVVQACADPQCNVTAENAVNTQLFASAPEVEWRGPSVNTSNNNQVELQFQNGLASASLSYMQDEEITLSLISSLPGPVNPDAFQCFVSGQRSACSILFRKAGLMFFDQDNQSPITPQVSATPFSARVRAIQTNSVTGVCEARVEGPQDLELSFDCVNPGTCQPGQQLRSLEPAQQITIGDNQRMTLPLTFDDTGGADITLAYTDAGRIELSGALSLAESETEPAIMLEGTSSPFVVSPADLQVEVPAMSEGFEHQVGRLIAGAPFELAVQAVNNEGMPTPNFGNESTPQNVEIVPVALVAPLQRELEPDLFASGDPQNQGLGRFETQTAVWEEAGSIEIKAIMAGNNYLGVPFLPASTVNVGRFYPHRLELEQDPDISFALDACTEAQPFTYLGAPAALVRYELVAKNVHDRVLQNYTTESDSGFLANIGIEFVHDTLSSDRLISNSGGPTTLHNTDWQSGVLMFNPSSTSDLLIGAERRASANMGEAGPYSDVAVRLFAISNPDNILIDSDVMQLSGELEFRFGRAVLDDISGPEDADLFARLIHEYWDGEQFTRNRDDNCSSFNATNLRVIEDLQSLNPQPQVLPESELKVQEGTSVGDLFWRLTEPRAGQFMFTKEVPEWLRYDWTGDGDFSQLPTALASFAQYRGNDRIIFWMEAGL